VPGGRFGEEAYGRGVFRRRRRQNTSRNAVEHRRRRIPTGVGAGHRRRGRKRPKPVRSTSWKSMNAPGPKGPKGFAAEFSSSGAGDGRARARKAEGERVVGAPRADGQRRTPSCLNCTHPLLAGAAEAHRAGGSGLFGPTAQGTARIMRDDFGPSPRRPGRFARRQKLPARTPPERASAF